MTVRHPAARPEAPPAGRSMTAALLALRLVGAGLTAAMAAIHLHLWAGGYQDLATIGVLFLLNAIGGGLLALALLAAPGDTWVPWPRSARCSRRGPWARWCSA